MLRFEALYEEWRVASVNLLEAEKVLLAESLREGGATPAASARVAHLRVLERDAYRKALAARDERGL